MFAVLNWCIFSYPLSLTNRISAGPAEPAATTAAATVSGSNSKSTITNAEPATSARCFATSELQPATTSTASATTTAATVDGHVRLIFQ